MYRIPRSYLLFPDARVALLQLMLLMMQSLLQSIRRDLLHLIIYTANAAAIVVVPRSDRYYIIYVNQRVCGVVLGPSTLYILECVPIINIPYNKMTYYTTFINATAAINAHYRKRVYSMHLKYQD